MSALRSAAWRNSAATVLAKGTLAAARIVFLLWVAGQSGPEAFGRLALCFAVVEILRMAVDFGTESLFLRQLARSQSQGERAHELARFGLFRVAALALGLLAYGLAVTLLLAAPFTMVDLLPGALLLTSAGNNYALTFYQSQLRMQRAAVILVPLLLVGAGIFVGLRPRALELQLALLVSFEVACCLALFLDMRRSGVFGRAGPGRVASLATLRDVARASLPLAGVALLATAYTRLDVLVIAPLAGPVALGLYSFAYRVSEPFRFVTTAVDSTLYSYLSARSERTRERAWMRKLFALVASYALLFAVGSAVVGWLLIWLAYDEYRPALPTLFVLSGALLIRCLNGLLLSTLYALGKFGVVLKIAMCNAGLMVVMIYPMVSLLGIVGAACSLLAVELVNFLLQGRVVLQAAAEPAAEIRQRVLDPSQ